MKNWGGASAYGMGCWEGLWMGAWNWPLVIVIGVFCMDLVFSWADVGKAR